jgi:hypothetical protein
LLELAARLVADEVIRLAALLECRLSEDLWETNVGHGIGHHVVHLVLIREVDRHIGLRELNQAIIEPALDGGAIDLVERNRQLGMGIV